MHDISMRSISQLHQFWRYVMLTFVDKHARMQMKDSIYDMLHEIFPTTLFLLVEIPDYIIQEF